MRQHIGEREMKQTDSQPMLNRRQLAVGAAAVATLSLLPVVPALAQDQPEAKAWEAMVKKILGDAKPTEGKVAIDMAEIAENGNTVPIALSVESPMTDKDYVKAIYIISTANPRPEVKGLVFYGFPLHPAGKPSVDRAEHLKEVKVKMLFLQGTKDDLASWDLIESVCSSLPKATLVKIDGANHMFKAGKRDVMAELVQATKGWVAK